MPFDHADTPVSLKYNNVLLYYGALFRSTDTVLRIAGDGSQALLPSISSLFAAAPVWPLGVLVYTMASEVVYCDGLLMEGSVLLSKFIEALVVCRDKVIEWSIKSFEVG